MRYLIILMIFLWPLLVQAYIGPGMAGGVILSILGIILALVVSLVGILYYPIKRFLNKKKK